MHLAAVAVRINISDPYVQIISASLILILSYIYNRIAERSNFPSVILLIFTGIGISLLLKYAGVDELNLMPVLEILGIIGLIMIVLEAALDLQLTRDKLPLIGKSLGTAFFCLIASTFAIAYILKSFLGMDNPQALLYATPLAIMSSAIIIPSVAGLILPKREFMIYESAFSDILGIMFFYFLISLLDNGGRIAAIQFGAGLVITIVVSIIASYSLVFLFKDMKGHIRLFLLIAILLLLYSAGKLAHLSPLLIILLFGLSLSNHKYFYKIFRNFFEDPKEDPIENIEREFHLITIETSFVVRSFFFVVFGMSISLSSLVGLDILGISLVVLVSLYVIRFIFLRLFLRKNINPELWIAPRGLITILLFYTIPEEYASDRFNSGILFYVIIISSLIMSVALMIDKRQTDKMQSLETRQDISPKSPT